MTNTGLVKEGFKIASWEDFQKHTRPKSFEICQGFDEKCKAFRGELVLAVEIEEKEVPGHNRGCFDWSGISSYLKRTIKIGVLRKDNEGLIITEHGIWFFPTGIYCILDYRLVQIKNNLYVSTLGSFLDLFLDKPIEKSTRGYCFPTAMELADKPKTPLKLEIKIGNDEVIEWFRKNNENFLGLLKVSKLLGLQLPEIPEIPRLINEERAKISLTLCQLLQKHSDLKKTIEAIYQWIGNGPFSTDGYSITQVEDKTDAFFFTYGQREKLNEVRGNISSLLSEAESIGVSEDELIKTMAEFYSQVARGMFTSAKK